MAITQLPDGRWICYYRVQEIRPERIAAGKKNRTKKEYFGRGADAEAKANKRNAELNLKKRRPPAHTLGPAFKDLAESYTKNKGFNPNSKKLLKIRLAANILPFFGRLPAIKITDQDLDNYVAKRRADPVRGSSGKILRYGVKNSTIARELTDIKAILSWSAARRPPLVPFNPVRDYKKPAEDNEIILPPTQKETITI